MQLGCSESPVAGAVAWRRKPSSGSWLEESPLGMWDDGGSLAWGDLASVSARFGRSGPSGVAGSVAPHLKRVALLGSAAQGAKKAEAAW